MARVYPVPSLLVRPFGSGIFTAVDHKTEDHGFAGSESGRLEALPSQADWTPTPSKVVVLSVLIGNSSLGLRDRVKYHRTPDFRRCCGDLRTILHPAGPLIGAYPENPDKTYASTYS